MRKILFHLFLHAHGCSPHQRTEPVHIIELGTRMTYEIQDRKILLVFCFSQTTTKLLQEDGQTLCRTKEEYCIYRRNIDTLVKHIYYKKIVNLLLCQTFYLDISILRILARQNSRLQASQGKLGIHVVSMLLVYTEA